MAEDLARAMPRPPEADAEANGDHGGGGALVEVIQASKVSTTPNGLKGPRVAGKQARIEGGAKLQRCVDEKEAPACDTEGAHAVGFVLVDAAFEGHSKQLSRASERLVGCLHEHLEQSIFFASFDGKSQRA